MEKFIGKKVKVKYVQELGWRQPISLTFNKKTYHVKEIISRWEEHTLEKNWRERKHRVWYEILLDNGNSYQLYWDRGAKGIGKDWVLVKELSKN